MPATLASTTQVPAAKKATAPELKLHSAVALVSTVSVTTPPEVAVAASGVEPPTVAPVTLAGLKVIVCGWAAVLPEEPVPAVASTVTFCSVVAARYVALAETDATMVQVPAAVKSTTPALYEHTVVEPELIVMVTGSPELAVALRGSLVPTDAVAASVVDHVIVCVCGAAPTTTDWVDVAAA